IFWGYFVDTQASIIHVFSALKNRLKTIHPEAEFAAYLLPDFLPAILDASVSKAIVKHQDRTSLFEKTAALGISVTPISAIGEEERLLPVFELIDVTPVTEFGLTIRFTRRENTSGAPVNRSLDFPFTNPILSAANMQNSELKKLQQQSKTQTNVALYLSTVAAIVILVGLCGFFQLRYLFRAENNFAKQLTQKDEHVKQIQQKEDRARELDLFSNKKHVYFRGLDQINELRPETILFKSVFASEGENFEIKCSAQGLDEVEKFRKNLENSALFKVIRIEDKSVQDNQTINFSLYLTFEKYEKNFKIKIVFFPTAEK
ncbi:MAG: PilN domain-containing protein, partial [Puniceicoccales bacterium]|nr:PilN domain-containing protein [Puniceicoccales bacterium]